MILQLVGLGLGALQHLPKGKGKRKASAEYLRAEAGDMMSLAELIQKTRDEGGAVDGIALDFLVDRLKGTMNVMAVAAEAFDPSEAEDSD